MPQIKSTIILKAFESSITYVQRFMRLSRSLNILYYNMYVQDYSTNCFVTLLSVYTAIQGIIDATHQQLEEIENTCAENNKVSIIFYK